MSIARLVLKLAIAGVAAKVFLNSKRRTALALSSPTTKDSEVLERTRPLAPGTPADVAKPMSAAPGTGSDSPNGAERLAASGFAQTPEAGFGDDLLKPNASDDPNKIVPGMPDFARGA